MKALLDRIQAQGYRVNRQDINDILNYFKSNPFTGEASQALKDCGVTQADMASTLLGLLEQNAVIDVSEYKRQTEYVPTPTQEVVSNTHRHGVLYAVSSSSKHLTMGLAIKDANVVNTETGNVGEPRIFNLTDHNGGFYQDCGKIKWINGKKELNFNSFVNGAIGMMLFNPAYITVSAMLERVKAEQKFIKSCKPKTPKTSTISSTSSEEITTEPKEKKEVLEYTMEADINLSEETYSSNDVLYTEHYQAERMLSFIKRMIELAQRKENQKPSEGKWEMLPKKRANSLPYEAVTVNGVTIKRCSRNILK